MNLIRLNVDSETNGICFIRKKLTLKSGLLFRNSSLEIRVETKALHYLRCLYIVCIKHK